MNRIILSVTALVGLFAVPAVADIGVSVSPTTWALGTFGPSYYIQSASYTVTNNGTCFEQLKIYASNSANWALTTGVPGQDQFKLTRYDNPTSQWLNVHTTTDTLITWFGVNTSTSFPLRFYGPATLANGETPTQQTILLMLQATAEAGFTYNAGGDFYWQDVGPAGCSGVDCTSPQASWSSMPSNNYLPSQDWSYMPASASNGWLPANTSITAASLYSFSFNNPTFNPMGGSWGWLLSSSIGSLTPTMPYYTTSQCPACSNIGSWFTNTATVAGGSLPYMWYLTGTFYWAQASTLSGIGYMETNSAMSTYYHGTQSIGCTAATVTTSFIQSYSSLFSYFSCPYCSFFNATGALMSSGSAASVTMNSKTWVVPANEASPIEAVILN